MLIHTNYLLSPKYLLSQNIYCLKISTVPKNTKNWRNGHLVGWSFQPTKCPLHRYFELQIYFTLKARVAFSTANTITPTSAKTAIPIVAIPTVESIRTATFTPIANTAFC